MKRVFCFLLALVLLPLISAAAADDDSVFVGIWVNERPSSTASRTVTTYQIISPQRVLYSSIEFFYDGSPAKTETAVYSCRYEKKSVQIMDGETLVKELFLVNDYKLSSDQKKTYGFYHRILETQADYDSAAAPDPEPVVNLEPFGKWSCCFDVSSLPVAYQNVIAYSLIVYDLYLFDNGAAYMTECHIEKDSSKPEFSEGALSGIWIGDKNDMTIQIASQTYKAKINDDGLLLLYMTKKLPLPFVRVDTTAAMIELLSE